MTANDYMEIVTPLVKEAWSDGMSGNHGRQMARTEHRR